MPAVSIILPLYNQQNYIAECLASVCRQTLADIEIVVVDDGSTDASAAIAAEFTARDERIRILSRKNAGYGAAMNAGIAAAKGTYIGIVETDDVVPPQMYKTLYEAAVKNGMPDLIKADFSRFYTERGRWEEEVVPLSADPSYYGRVLCPLQEPQVFSFPMNTWSGIYRRDFLEENGIRHNETPGASFQDNGFWFQTFCFAKQALFVHTPLYKNRRDNPASSVYDPGKVYCVREEYAFIDGILRKHPAVRKKIVGWFWLKKFHNYVFTLRRIAAQFRPAFAARMREEFADGVAKGEVDLALFGQSLPQLEALLAGAPAFLQMMGLAASEQPFFTAILLRTGAGFAAALKSVCNQTFADVQVVCAGEAFTQAERAAAGSDGRVEFLERKGLSAGALLCEALKAARGQYVHILAGATLVSAAYEQLACRLQTTGADAVICDADVPVCGMYAGDIANFRAEKLTGDLLHPLADAEALASCGVCLSNKLYRLSAIQTAVQELAGGAIWLSNTGECPQLAIAAAEHCGSVAILRERLVRRTALPDARVWLGCLRALLSIHPKEEAVQKGIAQLRAAALYGAGHGKEADLFALAALRQDVREAFVPARLNRDDFSDRYIYDYLLRYLYGQEDELAVEARTVPPAAYAAAGAAASNGTRPAVRGENGADRAALESVLHSYSFRIGRIATWLPRKVRDGLRRARTLLRGRGAGRIDRRGEARLKRQRPLVSIVLPLYNAAPYLRQSLGSLLAQTYPRIEIICVDDGSADDTCAIAAEFTAAHKNVRLLRQEHKFAGVARNAGFAACKGKYVLFLDADDTFDPHLVEKLAVRAEGTGADITVCRCSGFDGQTGDAIDLSWSVHEERLPASPVFSGNALGDYVCTAFMGWAWDKLYRVSFIRKHKLQFQDTRSSNDAYFVFTSLALARRISFIGDSLVSQRRGGGASLSQTRESSWDNCLLAADKIWQDWQARGIYARFERSFCNWAVNFFCWHLRTLEPHSREKLLAALPPYAEKYGLFQKPARYYYLKRDFEEFCSFLQGE